MGVIDEQRALAHLWTPLGQPGSGRLRYTAAMYFNRLGRLSDAALEVYRICSPKDSEDPEMLLKARGLRHGLPRPDMLSGELAIRLLVEEVGRYFATLSGPGVAEVRAGIAAWQGGPARTRSKPVHAVVEQWMASALDQLRQTHPALTSAIEAAVAHLPWLAYDGYPAEEIGADFAAGHAYAPIIGEDAAIPAVDWDMGLFLIAPHVLYRDHRHQAPELYAPLTGPHGWRFGPDRPLTVLPAHRAVWNDPFVPHLTKVGPTPFLCIYAWTKDVNTAAAVVAASDWATLERLTLEA